MRHPEMPIEYQAKRESSVLWGRDSDALNILIPLHAPGENPAILDCTHNQGVMWRGTAYKPMRADKAALDTIDAQADFTALPFAANSFDVMVFDPPHLPAAAASENSSGVYKERYGINDDAVRAGDNVAMLFDPFLREAQRVLRPEGIVLAKIADLTHNNRYQWQHMDFVSAARNLGMCPCDLLIKIHANGAQIMSSKWQRVLHLRKAHCYWIVIRNSEHCNSPRANAPVTLRPEPVQAGIDWSAA